MAPQEARWQYGRELQICGAGEMSSKNANYDDYMIDRPTGVWANNCGQGSLGSFAVRYSRYVPYLSISDGFPPDGFTYSSMNRP